MVMINYCHSVDQLEADRCDTSPRLEMPTNDPFAGESFFKHALSRRLPGQEIPLIQQAAPISPAVIVVHAV